MIKFLSYEVLEENDEILAQCGCGECRAAERGQEESNGQGHVRCHCSPEDLLAAETLGLVEIFFDDGPHWRINQNADPTTIAEMALDALAHLQRQVNLFLRGATSSATLQKAVE